jgi:isopenicillin-N N-acyltransferase-like protein
MEEQKENLILLTIIPKDSALPKIKMVTEAGMIGKIGLNSAGVGVCFNAIRAKGMNERRMPVHLGLRLVLESTYTENAADRVQSNGMASSAHMLIGDDRNAIGLEFTHSTFARLPLNSQKQIIHSNHLLAEHKGAEEPAWLEDSPLRVQRMAALTSKFVAEGWQPSLEEFSALFEDESNLPGAICRKQEGESTTATLFNIVMELREKRAVVRLGRPCVPEEVIHLSFGAD